MQYLQTYINIIMIKSSDKLPYNTLHKLIQLQLLFLKGPAQHFFEDFTLHYTQFLSFSVDLKQMSGVGIATVK